MELELIKMELLEMVEVELLLLLARCHILCLILCINDKRIQKEKMQGTLSLCIKENA